MTLPLPVKKNKFGQRVADIPTTDYYGQIMEEVLEAQQAANNAKILKTMNSEGCGQCAEFIRTNEPEELVDIITCCITRLDIIGRYESADKFFKLVDDNLIEDKIRLNVEIGSATFFYIDLAAEVMYSFHAAQMNTLFEIIDEGRGCGSCLDLFADYDEDNHLAAIICMCLKRLDFLGYDEEKRQAIYQAVNEKNRKRGYFED